MILLFFVAVLCFIFILCFQGSVVGGFLSQPADKYAVFQVPFFCKFPYIMPCFVGAAIAAISLICRVTLSIISHCTNVTCFTGSWLFLDETLYLHKVHSTARHLPQESHESRQPPDQVIELELQNSPSANVPSNATEETEIDQLEEQEVALTDIELLIENNTITSKPGMLRRMCLKGQEHFHSLICTILQRLKEMAQWFQSLQHCLYNCYRHRLRTEKAQGGFKTAVLGKLNAGWKKIMSMLAHMEKWPIHRRSSCFLFSN